MPEHITCSCGQRISVSEQETACPACGAPLSGTRLDRGFRPPLPGASTSALPAPPFPGTPDAGAESGSVLGWGAFHWRGRFTALAPHAHGGLGQISVARDEDLSREVALKQVRSEYAELGAARRRLVAEAEITAQLEHPGVVPIHALGKDEHGRPYYVMRFVRGRTLAEDIAAFHGGPLTRSPAHPLTPSFFSLAFRDLLRRFIDICQAVAFAHSKGIIHRDLKPSNVMLGEYGETIVLDWGLAKRQGAPELLPLEADRITHVGGMTRPGEVMGTPAYMAPEQAAGDQAAIGPASDVYSLGAILYEMLSGRLAREEGATGSTAAARTPPPRPSQLNSAVPRALEAICLRAMAPRPEERYTAAELARDIERWLADEPVAVYADPFAVRLGRWARRHRTLAAVLVALLVTALVAVTIGVFAVRAERDRTELARGDAVRNLELAQRQRERAERHYRRSLDAIDRMLSRVGEQTLRPVPHMEPTRRALLEDALVLFQEILSQEVEPEPELQFRIAAAHARRGRIRHELGHAREAEQDFHRSLALLDQLRIRDPQSAEYVGTQARVLSFLGVLYFNRDQLKEAEDFFGRAIAAYAEVAGDPLAVRKARSNSAEVRAQLATVLTLGGQLPKAEKTMREALAELMRLLEESARDADVLSRLATLQLNLGELYRRMDRLDEAEKAFREALALAQRSDLDPFWRRHHQARVAHCHNNLGLVAMARGQWDESLASFLAAERILDTLMRDHPWMPEYRESLAGVCTNLGVVYGKQLRIGESAAAFQKGALLWSTAKIPPAPGKPPEKK